jgi:hypothetical protein
MSSAALALFEIGYTYSPIILTGNGGIVSSIPGGMLPIIFLTEPGNFAAGLLSGGLSPSTNNFFASFTPLPGSTLIDQQIGTYPFANQQVAANAVITQPLQISMLMNCPAKGHLGYGVKLATMIALQNALFQHNTTGGTYTVITPAYIYTNCVMTGMRDVSSGDTKQVQVKYQLDFIQPLITLDQAQQAQNSLMSRLTAGSQVMPDATGLIGWSGTQAGIGIPSSGIAPSLIPSTSTLAGSGMSGLDFLGSNLPGGG